MRHYSPKNSTLHEIVSRGRRYFESGYKIDFQAKSTGGASRLRAMLPLTVDMSELNGNEKYFHLATQLPTHAANPGTIQNGDLMLWQSNSLVLFYKTFQTTYSYTRLGRIDDPAGLAAAVGAGSVTVKFES